MSDESGGSSGDRSDGSTGDEPGGPIGDGSGGSAGTETRGPMATLAALASGTRIGAFVSVGAVGFVFDVTVSTALQELGVFPEVAVAAGIEVAVVVMFLLNDRVTFASEGAAGLRPTLRRLARSHAVRAGGIAVQLATFSAMYRLVALELQVAGIDGWFVASKATGIAVGMVVNYVAESLFTWRVLAE